MVHGLYFAPSYFTSFYFGQFDTPPGTPIESPGQNPEFTDQRGYEELTRLLDATRLFSNVLFGRTGEKYDVAPAPSPYLMISPEGWCESDDWDPELMIRRVEFNLMISVSNVDPLRRLEELNWLTDRVRATINNASLGSSCLPCETKLSAARYEEKNHHPEQRVYLKGKFAYLVKSESETQS